MNINVLLARGLGEIGFIKCALPSSILKAVVPIAQNIYKAEEKKGTAHCSDLLLLNSPKDPKPVIPKNKR